MKTKRTIEFLLTMLTNILCFSVWIQYMLLFADMPETINDLNFWEVKLLLIINVLFFIMLFIRVFLVFNEKQTKGFILKKKYNIGFAGFSLLNMFFWGMSFCGRYEWVIASFENKNQWIVSLCNGIIDEQVSLHLFDVTIVGINTILAILLFLSLIIPPLIFKGTTGTRGNDSLSCIEPEF